MERSSMSVTELLLGKKHGEDTAVWQDREIRFDIPPESIDSRKGEILYDFLDDVEDTKGNKDALGEFHVTNLRVVWVAKKNRRTNICLGYNCVTAINIRGLVNRIRGETLALHILTKFNNQRFEFIFTNSARWLPRAFLTVQGVFKQYDTTRLYRDVKLRGAVIGDGDLRLLPQEQTYSKVNGVWNLSSEQGNLGSFFITNVRVVWHANLADNFNISVPYMQIKAVKVRESKFGAALVIETLAWSGGYILGFKIDPKETFEYVYKEIQSLWQVYSANPVFGIEYTVQDQNQPAPDALKTGHINEDVEIVDATDKGDFFASYYADPNKSSDREPMFNAELGLAVEGLKDGTTIDQLWNVI